MKISVITTAYNSAETIRATLESVRMQDHEDLEYIIIDGGSTDETMDIVADFDDIVSLSISEPDDGIYDALNKGIKNASGEVVGFLHSDDLFARPDVISRIARVFEDDEVDATYADLDYVQRNAPEKVVRKWRSKAFKEKLFYEGWMPAHPTFYLRREHYEQFGYYDTSFKQSADYELMLRTLLKHKLRAWYIPEVLVKMRVGGASNVTLQNRWQANKEDVRAWKKNGLKPGVFTRVMKPLSKLGQFFC